MLARSGDKNVTRNALKESGSARIRRARGSGLAFCREPMTGGGRAFGSGACQ